MVELASGGSGAGLRDEYRYVARAFQLAQANIPVCFIAEC